MHRMHRLRSVFLMVASTPLLSFELNVPTAGRVPLVVVHNVADSPW
jgi:hypothetical protein